MTKWLLYVRYNLSGLKVYSVETDDIYHCIGVLYCTSIEQIDRADYVISTEKREQYWKEQNIEIIERNDLHFKRRNYAT